MREEDGMGRRIMWVVNGENGYLGKKWGGGYGRKVGEEENGGEDVGETAVSVTQTNII